MGCNCSKKHRVRHIQKPSPKSGEKKTEEKNSKLSVLKEMWEESKKESNSNN